VISAGSTLRTMRERKPLVHQITNYVVMNETANATLALGALPVMAHAVEEVEEMVGLAGALVLNIGTLSPHWVEAMLAAGRRGERARVPGRARPGRRGRDALPHGHGAADPRRGRRDRPARQRRRGRDARRVEAEVRGVESIARRRSRRGPGARGGATLGLVASVTGPGRPRVGRGTVCRVAQRARAARRRHRHRLHLDRRSPAASSPVGRRALRRGRRRSSRFGVAARTPRRGTRGDGTFHAAALRRPLGTSSPESARRPREARRV
jgi:hypothetical protein